MAIVPLVAESSKLKVGCALHGLLIVALPISSFAHATHSLIRFACACRWHYHIGLHWQNFYTHADWLCDDTQLFHGCGVAIGRSFTADVYQP
jgi:hypothetical protein